MTRLFGKRRSLGRDFRYLWLGQAISQFGDELSVVAIPTLAILTLNATPLQIGVLTFLQFLPYPVLGLFAGWVVDRVARRGVLITADTVRFLARLTIPVAATLPIGVTFPHLLLMVAVVGIGTVFFDISYEAYVPALTTEISIANARLATTESLAELAGPAVGGILIAAVGAVAVVSIDAVTYLASALCLLCIRKREIGSGTRPSCGSGILTGLVWVWRHEILRRMTIASGIANLGRWIVMPVLILFVYRGLHLPPVVVGTVLLAGGCGGLAGAAVASRLRRRLGLARVLLLSSLGKGLPWCAIPIALLVWPVPVLYAIAGISGFSIPLWNVNAIVLRQTLTAAGMRGRVAAVTRTVAWGTIPVGGLFGGVLADAFVKALGSRSGLAWVMVVGGSVWAIPALLVPRRELTGLDKRK